MKNRTHRMFAASLCFALVLFTLHCSSRDDHSRWEKSVSAASVPSADPNAGLPGRIALAPPTDQDIRQAINRIYGGAVQLKSGPLQYAIGDFNGDDSDDLAVEVRPVARQIASLNDVAANWILEEPSQIFVPDPSKKVQKLPAKPPQPEVHAGERLLAIVHGYGPQGWREPLARQGYLLLNVPGKKIALQKKADILVQATDPVPHLFGDLIQSERQGRRALLFWTGGHYAWLGQARVAGREREVSGRAGQ